MAANYDVARALGWKFVETWSGSMTWEMPCGKRTNHVKDYFQDPATIPEMLAWLRDFGCNAFFQQYHCEDSGWHVDADAWPFIHHRMQKCGSGRCVTLNEALARLVVAVAEASTKKTP